MQFYVRINGGSQQVTRVCLSMSCRLLSQNEHPMYPDNVLDPARKESNLPNFAKGSVGDSTRLLAAFWKRHFRAVFNAYSRHLGCGGGEEVGPGITMAACIRDFSPLSANGNLELGQS